MGVYSIEILIDHVDFIETKGSYSRMSRVLFPGEHQLMRVSTTVTHGLPLNVLLESRDAVNQVLQHLLAFGLCSGPPFRIFLLFAFG